jgi:hypothetical protein
MRSGRSAHPVRLAVTGATAAELADELAAAADRIPAAQPRAAQLRVPRAVTLLVSGDEQPLAAALDALAGAFPELAAGAPAGSEEPAARLAAMVGLLGVRTLVEHRGDTPAEPVRMTWDADGGVRTVTLVGPRSSDAPGLLLDAVGALFAAGAELRLDALRGPGAALLGDLPTYPFQRRRFWIDEPAMGAGARERQAAEGPVSAATAPDPRDCPAVEAFLLRELQEVLHSDEPLDPGQSFLDGGGDSFISTLFITRVEEHYTFGLTAEELPLDLPLSELLGTLARDITDTALAGPPEER